MWLRWIRRARPSRWIWLAFLVPALCAAPGRGAAQVRPDTVPGDPIAGDSVVGDPLTIPIPAAGMVSDTLPADSLLEATPDSLAAAPALPPFGGSDPTGFASARWEWDRDELQRFHGLSLVDLIERVPGLLVTRSGGFGRPVGISFLDTGGGAVRFFRDGFELDPLRSAALDPQEIGLADLQAVRLTRSASEVRIELETFRLEDRRPFSQVEAATGNFEAKILRALFSRAIGSRSTVTGAYDLTATDGFTRDEPFSFSSGRVSWTFALSERMGLQAEYRLASLDRESSLDRFPDDSLYREDAERHEVVVRGRAELLPGLTLDALVGRTSRSVAESDSDVEASGVGASVRSGVLPVDLSSTQAALRTEYHRDFGRLEAAVRFRAGDGAGLHLPSVDLTVRGLVQPLPWLGVEGEARSTRMEGGQATRMAATGRAGPFRGVTLFATLGAGERWAGTVADSMDVRIREDSVVVDGVPQPAADSVLLALFGSRRAAATGLRAGAEWTARGATLGAAFLTSGASVSVPYGLAFDFEFPPLDTGAASGVEAYGSIPIPFWFRGLRLEGSYSNWLETGGRPYLPLEQARVALEFHGRFIEDQFEPTIRVESVYRGSSLGPSPDRSGFGEATEAYSMANLFLQIRILDVRAFMTFQNFLNNDVASDVPGLRLAGPRTLYGLRWHFRN